MARLIDADALKKFLHEEDFETPDERWRPESEFAKMIEYAPTVDAVEAVRCKDCKYSNDDGTICRYSVGRAVEPEHFCGYGERKVSENENK